MPISEDNERAEAAIVMLQQNGNNEVGIKPKRHDRKPSGAFPRIVYAWTHATVGPVFFFFLAAYMLQTSLVKTYVEKDIYHKHNLSLCENHTNSISNSSTMDEHLSSGHNRFRRSNLEHNMHNILEHEDSEHFIKHESVHHDVCHERREDMEKELSYWHLVLLIIYAGPTLILAPVLGSWTDGLHRVIPMYICALGMALSTLCVAIAMLLTSSTEVVVYCTMPSGLTGGAVLFTVAMYSYEAEKKKNFEIFESYLTLQCIYVAAKTLIQLLVHYSSTFIAKAALIWVPLVFSLIACFGLLHRRIRDDRPVRFHVCNFTFVHLPKDFLHMIKKRLWALHFLLFLCAFVFYFAYVGETSEIMNIIIHDEPWEIASFSIYGAAQGVTESVGLLITLYFWKTIIHKKIIDKELLPHFSVFILGILGYVSDMATKIIVSITPETSVQYWEPLIGVISELAIVVIRYFMVLLVAKEDVGKVLSLVGIAQILSTVPGAISAKALHAATLHWWPNFIYLFLALIQLIPIGFFLFIMKFAHLPNMDLHPEEHKDKGEEEKKENKIEDEHSV